MHGEYVKRTTNVAIFCVWLVLAVLSTSCAVNGDPADSPLVGEWELVSGNIGDDVIPLVEGSRITFISDGSTFGGTAACNRYGGTVTVEAWELSMDEIFITEMACEPDVMASEQAYVTALQSANGASRDGDVLLLSSDDTELWFIAQTPVDTEVLVGPIWTLDSLIEGASVSTTLGEDLTLHFADDGTLEAMTGCRILTGTYVVTGDQVDTPELSAKGECTAALEAQDGHVVAVFEGGFTTAIEGDRLTLTASGGQGLMYRAQG